MIDRDRIAAAVRGGLVKAVTSNTLTLYSYTQKCVYERAWDDATLACRGLILCADGLVAARPFRKFFNLGEPNCPPIPPGEPEIAEKLDGSLVIVFFCPDTERWRAVTRGSWDSEQAKAAQAWLDERGGLQGADIGTTYLFEIVAPWNRIVIHYPEQRMILLGAIDNVTGLDASYEETEGIAAYLGLDSVAHSRGPLDAIDLADPNVRDAEGFVARWPCGTRVKLKYGTYLLLHKVVTGLSVKSVWQLLARGEEPDLSGVPDEFLAWYTSTRDGIRERHAEFARVVSSVWESRDWRALSRKECAQAWAMLDAPAKASLFCQLDGKPWDVIAWNAAKPERDETFYRGDAGSE